MKFIRGLQHLAFEEANCLDCLNYKSINNNKPLCKATEKDNGFGCPIMDAHILYQNEMTDNISDTLIPTNGKCKMKLNVNEVKDIADRILVRQNEDLKQKIINLKQGYNQQNLF